MPGSLISLAIVIISVIVGISRSAQKNIENRPGQGKAQQPTAPGANPMPGAKPAPVAPVSPVTPVAPHAAPAATAQGTVLDETDYARTDLDEGDSRECDHGSVGGSMDITSHQGQGDEYQRATQQVEVRVKAHVRSAGEEKTPAAVAAPARMTVEEMRRAVVMAEILKRPAERRGFGRRAYR